MKKTILAAVTLISVVFVGTANAQSTSDVVTVNIKLAKVQSIVINPSQKPVDLEYNNETDYRNGVIKTEADHLTVFSTGGFIVQAKSDGDFKKGSESIAANTVTLSAAAGSKEPTGTVTYGEDLGLSTSVLNLITAQKGGFDLKFNVIYKGGKGNDYIVDRFKDGDGNPNVYTAEVTYSIIAN